MKTSVLFIITFAIAISYIKGREANKARFIDLNTGKRINLTPDKNSGLAIDLFSGRPVNIYVNLDTRDTIYAPSGKVINGELRRDKNGNFHYRSEEINKDLAF